MTYIAFLRAINVTNRRIRMADLRDLYETLGYRDVDTHLATGNVIFEASSPPLPVDLEDSFYDRFGFVSDVFLRSNAEIQDLVNDVPWKGEGDVVEVSFLEEAPDLGAVRALEATAVAPEELAVVRRETFFLRGLGRGVQTIHKESTAMKILDMRMTRRGMATVVGLQERYLLPRG